MKNRPRGGLGRGLGALIPTAPAVDPSPPVAPMPTTPSLETPVRPVADDQLAPVPGARFAELPVTSIVPNAKQPRHVFDEEALEELKISIQEVGFLQPIVV